MDITWTSLFSEKRSRVIELLFYNTFWIVCCSFSVMVWSQLCMWEVLGSNPLEAQSFYLCLFIHFIHAVGGGICLKTSSFSMPLAIYCFSSCVVFIVWSLKSPLVLVSIESRQPIKFHHLHKVTAGDQSKFTKWQNCVNQSARLFVVTTKCPITARDYYWRQSSDFSNGLDIAAFCMKSLLKFLKQVK